MDQMEPPAARFQIQAVRQGAEEVQRPLPLGLRQPEQGLVGDLPAVAPPVVHSPLVVGVVHGLEAHRLMVAQQHYRVGPCHHVQQEVHPADAAPVHRVAQKIEGVPV